MELISIILIGIGVYLILGIRIVKEYQRCIRFRLGKFNEVVKPGIRMFFPFIDTYERVDLRIMTVDVPYQEAITKDNVSTKINAVLYYKIMDSKKAVLDVENYYYATSELAQITMRNVIGEFELDNVLSSREEISAKIKKIVDEATDEWGIKVESVELKDIILPDDMKRVLARQAEAEREKRAVILQSEGELEASKNVTDAAKKLNKQPGALHLRTLHTLNDMSSDKSNTIVFTIPLELIKSFEGMKKNDK
ncbi:MAG: slipin family protein [archaeon]